MQAEVKDAYWKIFSTGELTAPPGPGLVEIIDTRITEMAAKYGPPTPASEPGDAAENVSTIA